MTIWYRILFLFSSFGPLYLLLGVSLAVQHNWEKGLGYDLIVLAIVACAFLLSIYVFLRLQRGFSTASPSYRQIKPTGALDENVLSYMLAYIPPLIIDDLTSVAKVAPAGVYYFVLFLVMAKTDTIYVNPYFLFFNYRIFRAELPSKRSVVVITKRPEIRPGATATLHELQPGKMYFVSSLEESNVAG